MEYLWEMMTFSHVFSLVSSSCCNPAVFPFPTPALQWHNQHCSWFSYDQWCFPFEAGWRWLWSDMGQPLDSTHRSHPCSPLLPKTLPCKSNRGSLLFFFFPSFLPFFPTSVFLQSVLLLIAETPDSPVSTQTNLISFISKY